MAFRDIQSLPRQELLDFVNENVGNLLEDEALAVLDNPYATPAICPAGSTPRLRSESTSS